jgi:hypothetical protein
MCGADPATDTMLMQAALAGVLSIPFFFRERASRIVRRLRGMPDSAEESCPLAPDIDDEA